MSTHPSMSAPPLYPIPLYISASLCICAHGWYVLQMLIFSCGSPILLACFFIRISLPHDPPFLLEAQQYDLLTSVQAELHIFGVYTLQLWFCNMCWSTPIGLWPHTTPLSLWHQRPLISLHTTILDQLCPPQGFIKDLLHCLLCSLHTQHTKLQLWFPYESLEVHSPDQAPPWGHCCSATNLPAKDV